ncbi:hypothetical protein [Mesorhizobium neociceri]|uniref:Uncharacterized protein n=1 Tax=Mesorhizobium neociceri TaxID=1307853 RepID=A0A838B245_9HYPH|nr:hypothetical protein [Mesorhizobium neociceri]MBA1139959.1 hypothetical protein [Mesorhizobium neociceri]
MSEKISKPAREANGVCGTSPLVGSFAPKGAARQMLAWPHNGIAGGHGLMRCTLMGIVAKPSRPLPLTLRCVRYD